MPRFHLNRLPKEQRIQLIGEFYDVICLLRDRKEVRAFCRDLLNPDEVAMLMRRIEIAALLMGNFTYEEIMEMLGVGRATVTSVQKALLRHGEGYRIVVSRLVKIRKHRLERKQREFKKTIRRQSLSPLEHAKRKYPAYFLLFNLIDEIRDRWDAEGVSETRTLKLTPSRRSKTDSV